MPFLLDSTRLEVRGRIEAAAQKLFVKKGYAATSTRDIAEASGLTAGALYTHYRSKAELFAAVVEDYRTRLATDDSSLQKLLAETTFPDDLPQLAAAVRELVRDNREYWILWYVDVLEFEGAHFESALAPRALLASPGLKKRLAKLGAEGRLRVEPSVAFVMAYMHLFNFFLVESVFRGKNHYGVGESEAIRVMMDVFLHGMIAAPEERRAPPKARRRASRT